MKLNETQARVLIHIAIHPDNDRESIADQTGFTPNQVGRSISHLQSHMAIVHQPSIGWLENEARNQRTQIQSGDSPAWVLTGYGKQRLRAYRDQKRTEYLQAVSGTQGFHYVPQHAREEVLS